jgi:hypothetical protein
MSTGRQVTAETIRQRLLQGSADLLADKCKDVLGLALRHFFPGLKRAFVMHWIPEQGEDIYWVLVSSTEIAEIEIPRAAYAESNPSSLRIMALDVYQKKRHSRDVRQKLEIGVELMKEH